MSTTSVFFDLGVLWEGGGFMTQLRGLGVSGRAHGGF